MTFAYQTGGDGVEVRIQDNTIWLSQKNMGQLFDTSSDNIGLHLKNIFKGELQEISVRSTKFPFAGVAGGLPSLHGVVGLIVHPVNSNNSA